jgi:hypothetical protein
MHSVGLAHVHSVGVLCYARLLKQEWSENGQMRVWFWGVWRRGQGDACLPKAWFGGDICIPHEKSRTCSWRDLEWEGFYADAFVVAASICFLLQSVKKNPSPFPDCLTIVIHGRPTHVELWELSYKGPTTPCAVRSKITLLSVTHTTAPSPQCNIKIGVCDVRG